MKQRKSLEAVLEKQAKSNYVKHFDPVDVISHHLVLVIFLALMFLMTLMLFFATPQTPGGATAFAIIKFEPITFHHDVANGISDFIQSVRHREDRPLVLLTLYTFWIIIFGLINMVLYERKIHKEFNKK